MSRMTLTTLSTVKRFLCRHVNFHHGGVSNKGTVEIRFKDGGSFPLKIHWTIRKCEWCGIPFATNDDLTWR